VEGCEDEDGGLTQTGLGLAENVLVEESGGDGILLDCGGRRMLDFEFIKMHRDAGSFIHLLKLARKFSSTTDEVHARIHLFCCSCAECSPTT